MGLYARFWVLENLLHLQKKNKLYNVVSIINFLDKFVSKSIEKHQGSHLNHYFEKKLL